jgi:hypothetical protein
MAKKSNRKSKNAVHGVVRRSPVSGHAAKGREGHRWFVNILVAESGAPTAQFLKLLEVHREGDLLNLPGMVDQVDSARAVGRVKRVVRVHSGPEFVSIAGKVFTQVRVLACTNCADELAALTGAIAGLSFRVFEGNLKVDEELSDGIVYEGGRRVIGAV